MFLFAMLTLISAQVFASKLGPCTIASAPPHDGIACEERKSDVLVYSCAETFCVAPKRSVQWLKNSRCKSEQPSKPTGAGLLRPLELKLANVEDDSVVLSKEDGALTTVVVQRTGGKPNFYSFNKVGMKISADEIKFEKCPIIK